MKLDLTKLRLALSEGTVRLPVLPPAAQAFLGCGLLGQQPGVQVWAVDHVRDIEQLADCFQTLCPEAPVLKLPPCDEKDMEVQGERLKTLSFLQRNGKTALPFVLITAVQCLAEKLPDVRAAFCLKNGMTLPPDHFFASLGKSGYVLDAEVYEKGTAARRGGILDIWPPTETLPVRIEFFGDEIDSLRTFDPGTQRSVEKIETVEIFPLQAGGTLALSGFLPTDALIIFSNPGAVSCRPALCPASSAALEIGCVTSDTFDLDLSAFETGLRAAGELHRAETAEQKRAVFFQTVKEMLSGGWEVCIVTDTPGTADRIREAWFSEAEIRERPIRFQVGRLYGSFICKEHKYLVLTEADLYGFQPRTAHLRREGKAVRSAGARVAEWSDIQPGETVVHVNHGLGKYMGLMEIEMAGRRQEMLLIEYAEKARLYLPVSQAHLLTRYTGLGNAAPSLHNLKGARWQNERASAQAAIEDFAAKMLETQAARALNKGRACGPDTRLQREFEQSFPYMETPDQISAVQAVKDDLESPRPMDRLICGDAGYGKTEVAMRAAFKTVMEGRQTAVLVPTTILAQQHFDVFTERMAAFPVRIEMLSRFRSRREQTETVRRLREGEADIVIGTHRLVSGDIQFRDLGLIIIDEEQRFGVHVKEYLKQLRKQADVLTLSATPIPRTLYMSLTGARDMSTIQTPPQERQPVETVVLEYHDDLVTEAIRHELARDGQVFYLHNRVQTIGTAAEKVKELVPEARVEYAHGQMSEKQLSDAMHRFVHGDFDVLLCTTIVESGVDIPRVNTILIDRADRFGLADLYQLRGRVGRSRVKAYAFLLLPPGGTLSEDSRKRIEALKHFTGCGTGFRIAMRDLEIRGAGNLLGTQQSGHIAAIGFELYCQLLKRSIARMQGKKVPPVIDTAVDLDFLDRSPSGGAEEDAAFIPYSYVEEETLRVKLYGRIASLAAEHEVRELRKEFADRFGKLPAAVKNLFEIACIRIAAAKAGLQTVRTSEERIILIRSGEAVMPGGRYPRLTARTTPSRLKQIHRAVSALVRVR